MGPSFVCGGGHCNSICPARAPLGSTFSRLRINRAWVTASGSGRCNARGGQFAAFDAASWLAAMALRFVDVPVPVALAGGRDSELAGGLSRFSGGMMTTAAMVRATTTTRTNQSALCGTSCVLRKLHFLRGDPPPFGAVPGPPSLEEGFTRTPFAGTAPTHEHRLWRELAFALGRLSRID